MQEVTEEALFLFHTHTHLVMHVTPHTRTVTRIDHTHTLLIKVCENISDTSSLALLWAWTQESVIPSSSRSLQNHGFSTRKKGSTGPASKQIVAKIVEVVKPIVQADIALSLFLIVVEKLMETEFICPCNSSNNFVSNVLLSCSSLIILFATVFIKMDQYKKLEKCCDCSNILRLFGVLLSVVLVVLLWLFVLFFDGHYYVCKRSSWDGTWKVNSTDVPHKWCQPPPEDRNFDFLKKQSVELLFESQVWLMHLL